MLLPRFFRCRQYRRLLLCAPRKHPPLVRFRNKPEAPFAAHNNGVSTTEPLTSTPSLPFPTGDCRPRRERKPDSHDGERPDPHRTTDGGRFEEVPRQPRGVEGRRQAQGPRCGGGFVHHRLRHGLAAGLTGTLWQQHHVQRQARATTARTYGDSGANTSLLWYIEANSSNGRKDECLAIEAAGTPTGTGATLCPKSPRRCSYGTTQLYPAADKKTVTKTNQNRTDHDLPPRFLAHV